MNDTFSAVMNKSFPTINEAYNYAAKLSQALPFQASRVWEDLFESARPKKNFMLRLIGVDRKTDKFCQKVAPGGTWNVEIEAPGSEYERAGIFGPRIAQTQYYRASAWYSRYLPYAYGMMMAEWEFKYWGINHQSINSYYGTVGGFVSLGQGDANIPAENNHPAWNRIDPDDVKLYNKIYDASMSVKSPSLPFDEAFAPALAYTACFLPQQVYNHCGDWWGWKHVCEVFEYLKRPIPKVRKSCKSA